MSDQDNSIFEGGSDTQNNQQQNNNSDAGKVTDAQDNSGFADLLSQIKNERGEPKYKNVQDALNGLLHAQTFISTLKNEQSQKDTELQRLREEAQRLQVLEETVARLTSTDLDKKDEKTTQPELSEEKLAELVNKTLTKREQEILAKQNLKTVTTAFAEAFGTEAEKTFYGKASEVGLTRDEVNALAAKSPAAVFKMLGVSAPTKPNNGSPTQGSINSSGLTPAQQTFLKRNDKTALVGATTQELQEASTNANKMVEELHKQGKTVHDLTDPRTYNKYFGNI